jgi:imidazolonepropionase-like amidohydrolase
MRGFVKTALAVVALFVVSGAAPTVTADQLAKPPADAQRFTILSKAGPHGTASAWTLANGTRMARWTMNLRGQLFEIEETIRPGVDGMPAAYTMQGFTPSGDAGETFAVAGGRATWKSQIDQGSAAYTGPALYIPAGPSFTASSSALVEAILRAPNKTIALLPGGKATAEKLTELAIGEGGLKRTVVCWGISGLGLSPAPVWATQDGKFFAAVGGLAALPVDYEGALEAMTKAQDDALAARSPAIARALLKAPSAPVAFTHVRAFVDGTRFVEDQTVIVDKGLITHVGPAASTPVPAGAQVIDGKGHTLVPGLWDSHMHFGDDFQGPMLLSLGITSARDPGNDDSLTVARAERRARGDLLSPHVYASSLIDGKGPLTAQVANVATTQDEAIALVRKAHAAGFIGVKFYGSFNPAWVKSVAAEAHRLGMHVHGHIPAGMRTHQAIEAGYNEITHIYFTLMEGMPEDVVKASNTIQRIAGPGRHGVNLNPAAPPMSTLFALMARKHVSADPTLVVLESTLYAQDGQLAAAYAPYIGTLPPTTERSFLQGGLQPPPDLSRAHYRASFAKIVQLVGAMRKAGVTIVAGTDGSGMELVRELELYEQAGFTREEALASATIVAARNVGADKTTGSIVVGKAADLVLVEGDPSRRIGDLRNTRVVMMDGKLMDADALRTAAGFSGRPKMAQ